MPRIDLSKTAQERHDQAMSRAMRKRKLEALLPEKDRKRMISTDFLLGAALKNHLKLTIEQAEIDVEAFGF